MNDHPSVAPEDTDARLGGNDDPVLLETLHADAEQVADESKRTWYEVQIIVNPDGPVAWRLLGQVRGSSARDAMRQLADQAQKGDVLRAIPVRNITQLTLDVETTTRMRLS